MSESSKRLSWIVTLDVLKYDFAAYLANDTARWIVTLDVLKSKVENTANSASKVE